MVGIRNDEPQNTETVGDYLDEIPFAVNAFNQDNYFGIVLYRDPTFLLINYLSFLSSDSIS
jgi:hypothetical protein